VALTPDEQQHLMNWANTRIKKLTSICIKALGYNAIHVEQLSHWGNPTPPEEGDEPQHPNTFLLLSGENVELGRWWVDMEQGKAYVQATEPEVKMLFYAVEPPAGGTPSCPA
jgi:hypothetical protein